MQRESTWHNATQQGAVGWEHWRCFSWRGGESRDLTTVIPKKVHQPVCNIIIKEN